MESWELWKQYIHKACVCVLPVPRPPVCAAAAAVAAAEGAAGNAVMPGEWESKGCWEKRLEMSQWRETSDPSPDKHTEKNISTAGK